LGLGQRWGLGVAQVVDTPDGPLVVRRVATDRGGRQGLWPGPSWCLCVACIGQLLGVLSDLVPRLLDVFLGEGVVGGFADPVRCGRRRPSRSKPGRWPALKNARA
jgi:hypothetical protein